MAHSLFRQLRRGREPSSEEGVSPGGTNLPDQKPLEVSGLSPVKKEAGGEPALTSNLVCKTSRR